VLGALALVTGAAGCGPRAAPRARSVRVDVPVAIAADSAARLVLPVARSLDLPSAAPRASLVQIAPARASLDPPPPEATPAPPPEAAPPPAGNAALQPPIPRAAARLVLAHARGGSVELDVRVDERGEVSDVEPVGGDADSATVAAVVAAAYAMPWYPALLRGRPVAVWCRQRFEVARR